LGLLAAAVGAWMYFVPADWFLGGLAEAWHLGMFTGAGALLAAAFGLFAYEVRKDEERWTTAASTAAVVATLALAAAVTFAVSRIDGRSSGGRLASGAWSCLSYSFRGPHSDSYLLRCRIGYLSRRENQAAARAKARLWFRPGGSRSLDRG